MLYKGGKPVGELKGKTAIVTGGSRGIGRAISIKFAENGINVVVNYSSNYDSAQKVVEEIQDAGGNALAVKADVSNIIQVDELVKKTVEKFGGIDILVNNAGITRDGLLVRMKEKDWNDVIDINLKGVYNCTKTVSRYMIKKRTGKIINITSVVGLIGNAGQSNYCAAKAGIIGFTKAVAKELAPRGINVNAVAPGLIDTDMTKTLPESLKKQMIEQIPLGRYGDPDDVANVVMFLASEDSDYITGQIINVDGGMVM